MLDVVVMPDDLPAPSVNVTDVDLSDHRLLSWQAPLVRPCPSYSTVTSRLWNRLDLAEFRAELLQSSFCCSDAWSNLPVDALAQLYDDKLTAILDWLVPVRAMRFRHRISDPWFDDDCRVGKHCVRFFDIWTKFGTDLKFHTLYTPEWSNSQPQNTRCRLPPSWIFRLCEIKKMSVAPDWMKIYASNFMESCTGH